MMSEGDTGKLPELKTVVGAMIFGANRSLSIKEMFRCVKGAADTAEGRGAAFAGVKERDVREAVEALQRDVAAGELGFLLREVAGGFRLQSDVRCGIWLKHLLDIGKPSRLSLPALETLAIVAYRQPVTKSGIENVRGVTVDHVLRTLMEMQLVRITGRSELPGRPFLYGTTQGFLEHFGLKGLDELSDVAPMLKAVRDLVEAKEPADGADGDAAGEDGDNEDDDDAGEPQTED